MLERDLTRRELIKLFREFDRLPEKGRAELLKRLEIVTEGGAIVTESREIVTEPRADYDP